MTQKPSSEIAREIITDLDRAALGTRASSWRDKIIEAIDTERALLREAVGLIERCNDGMRVGFKGRDQELFQQFLARPEIKQLTKE